MGVEYDQRTGLLSYHLNLGLEDTNVAIDNIKFGLFVLDPAAKWFSPGSAEYEKLVANQYQSLQVAQMASARLDPNDISPPEGTVAISLGVAGPGWGAQGGFVFSIGSVGGFRIFGGTGPSSPGPLASVMYAPNGTVPGKWSSSQLHSAGFGLGYGRESGTNSWGVTTPGISSMKLLYR